jgi:hypothetical protein
MSRSLPRLSIREVDADERLGLAVCLCADRLERPHDDVPARAKLPTARWPLVLIVLAAVAMILYGAFV